jgi:predicted molibdopterin-dependent oxidoreductase YjgC
VAGLATCFGSGAMSNSMDDVARGAEAFFIIGSNTTEQHPVFGTMLRRAVSQRGAKLVVADPRRIEITDFATLHLRHRPGTDVALINGLMHIILERDWENREFIATRTEGFEELKELLTQYPPQEVAEITGLPVEQLYEAAEILATSKPTAVIWAMGITQHIVGVRNVMDLANLQMLLGNMGVPGGGVNPLRGQNSVQGACDLGGLPNVYTGYQPVTNEDVRRKFEEAWGTPLSDHIGSMATEMMPDMLTGSMRGLYILGEDPVMSEPDSNHIRQCLSACEFVLLQEIFPSESSPYADVLLPGACFAEKTGTNTNTERRIQMVRKAVDPPGEARQDWRITSDLAKRVLAEGKRRVNGGKYAGWDYADTAQIMTEIAALTPSYAGVSHERLERGEPLQWPVKDATHPGTPILHVGQFARGLGKFMPVEHIPPAEMPDDEYPFLLSTGRVLYHWHGGEMTRRARGLLAVYSQALVEVNPDDAVKIGLNGHERVRITSRRGKIEAAAWVTDRVPPGMVFANFHFPGDQNANVLTIAALDPVAKIPEFKVCAVKVESI